MKTEPAATSPAQKTGLRVVGIGASSGGLSALRTLFAQIPPVTNVAWVVVMHLSPEHESLLPQLLQSSSRMPVRQVTDTVVLEPDQVYVIPPNANLDSVDTHLRLSELEQSRIARAPIDHFLRTLAATRDGRSIGVILTGAGSDGTLGLRSIREGGGLTLAQDPDEADYDSMPRSAISTGMVDVVAPLRDMPGVILRFCAVRPDLPTPDENDAIDPGHEALLQQVLARVDAHSGQDFSVFKRSLLLQRIGKRMRLHGVDSLPAYLQVLLSDGAESAALHKELVLNVSEFFSDTQFMEGLEQSVLPELFRRKTGSDDRLRVWTVGCSTGEEAYSVAMLMLERDPGLGKPALLVFATDLSDSSLGKARDGVYPQEIAVTVSPERLERFFAREEGFYRVRPEVRELVVFAAHNLFQDAPYSRIDLIICRGLLRDLQPAVRQGVLQLFHFALEPHGLLLLGDDDEMDAPHLFSRVDPAAPVYRRASGPLVHAPLPWQIGAFRHEAAPGGTPRTGPAPIDPHDVAVLHRQAVELHQLPTLLVDAQDQVVHYSRDCGAYLRLPGGTPTRDLIELVDEPIRTQLRVALDMVRTTGREWNSPSTPMWTRHGQREVVLRVQPLAVLGTPQLLLVTFIEDLARSTADPAATAAAPEADQRQVEEELAQTNRQLLALVQARAEDHSGLSEAAAQLQSVSGELGSTREELARSHEELQVVNEELKTLDCENRFREREIAQISADLQHLLESTGLGTLFLDCELRITRFTPQLAELFPLRRTDIGRPLGDITHTLLYQGFDADARAVLRTRTPFEVEVRSSANRWYLMRMLPYRKAPDRVDGVVVSFIDIHERWQAEELLREADRRKDEFLAVLAHELRNPLAPITAGVELLKRKGGEPQIVEQVATMMGRQSRQLVRLVDDLLEISRISRGKLQLHMTTVAVADVVADAVAATRPSVERARHQLSVRLPDAALVVHADPARLTQIIANLLGNAARYTPRGGQLSIQARRAGDTVEVAITDNGIGMDEEVLGQVFEMFYQGSADRSESGLGIGLTLARTLARMHGGDIRVSSAGPGAGSTFTLTLPSSGDSLPEESTADRPVDLEGKRILIVDDNVDAAFMLRELLQALGVQDAHVASGGRQGLRLAEELRPDLLLLDLMMPDMEGYEVARQLRSQPWGQGILLVALSGWGQEGHRVRAQEAGFDRHLTKPVDIEVLKEVLDQAPCRQRHDHQHPTPVTHQSGNSP